MMPAWTAASNSILSTMGLSVLQVDVVLPSPDLVQSISDLKTVRSIMKCIFGEAQNAHAPARYMRYGRIGEFPESPERVTRLLDGVNRAGLDIAAPRSFALKHLAAVHSERYLDFL